MLSGLASASKLFQNIAEVLERPRGDVERPFKGFCRIIQIVIMLLVSLGAMDCFPFEPNYDLALFESKTTIFESYFLDGIAIWKFSINLKSGHLKISGEDHTIGHDKWGRYPTYCKVFDTSFDIGEINTLLDALKKWKKWARTAKENEVKAFDKEIVNMGKGIKISFEADKHGKIYLVIKNVSWTRDSSVCSRTLYAFGRERRAGIINLEWETVDKLIYAFDNYETRYKEYKTEQDNKYNEYIKEKEQKRKEKKMINSLFK